jgi:hypothetical protein
VAHKYFYAFALGRFQSLRDFARLPLIPRSDTLLHPAPEGILSDDRKDL